MMTSIVQLSDTHIREPGRLAYGHLDTARYLRRAVQAIYRMHQAPQALVLTGDLADFGRPAEYRYLRALLAPLHIPCYVLPGNHDDRHNLRAAFHDLHYLGVDGFMQYAVDIGPLRLIALDTAVPGASHGELCDQRLRWLELELQRSGNQPVIIAMHHPPFSTLIGHMDEMKLLKGAARLEEIVARHANVERVICGHVHRSIEVRFGGTIAACAPSTAHQITLNLSPDAPADWVLEPPAFRVHAWDAAQRRLITHTAPIGEFPGPYSFDEPGPQRTA